MVELEWSVTEPKNQKVPQFLDPPRDSGSYRGLDSDTMGGKSSSQVMVEIIPSIDKFRGQLQENPPIS